MRHASALSLLTWSPHRPPTSTTTHPPHSLTPHKTFTLAHLRLRVGVQPAAQVVEPLLQRCKRLVQLQVPCACLCALRQHLWVGRVWAGGLGVHPPTATRARAHTPTYTRPQGMENVKHCRTLHARRTLSCHQPWCSPAACWLPWPCFLAACWRTSSPFLQQPASRSSTWTPAPPLPSTWLWLRQPATKTPSRPWGLAHEGTAMGATRRDRPP